MMFRIIDKEMTVIKKFIGYGNKPISLIENLYDQYGDPKEKKWNNIMDILAIMEADKLLKVNIGEHEFIDINNLKKYTLKHIPVSVSLNMKNVELFVNYYHRTHNKRKKPVIKLNTLEIISKDINRLLSEHEFIKLLYRCNVDEELIKHPVEANKSLDIFAYLTYCKSSRDYKSLFRIICDFCFPSTHNGKFDLCDKLIKKYNKLLKYNNLKIIQSEKGPKVVSIGENNEIVEFFKLINKDRLIAVNDYIIGCPYGTSRAFELYDSIVKLRPNGGELKFSDLSEELQKEISKTRFVEILRLCGFTGIITKAFFKNIASKKKKLEFRGVMVKTEELIKDGIDIKKLINLLKSKHQQNMKKKYVRSCVK